MKTPEERLESLELAAASFYRIEVPIQCIEARYGPLTLAVTRGVGRYRFSRDLGVSGGERDITRDRALEYIAGTVTDPLAD